MTLRGRGFLLLGLAGLGAGLYAQEPDVLPGTARLTLTGDMSAQMVAGIDRFLDRELEASIAARPRYWQRDLRSAAAYERSVAPNRERLRRLLGAVDPRVFGRALELVADTDRGAKLAETSTYEVLAVRWPVFDGVFGEGLLLQPKGRARASLVALPDADQTPEMLAGLAPGLPPENQLARRLAEQGCRVLVPVLLSRAATWSGIPGRATNLPHREWIYRQAFEVGRHIIGYEVQKVLAAVDWFARATPTPTPARPRIGLAGYGEGGLIALAAAALDPRVDAVLVSGYFDSRQHLWREPIYRNTVALLREFGDAEIASLIAPRALLVEPSLPPRVDGPPAPAAGQRNLAAPGKIVAPDPATVRAELARARALVGEPLGARLQLVADPADQPASPFAERAQSALLAALGETGGLRPSSLPPPVVRVEIDVLERQRRQVKQLEQHTQALVRSCERQRQEVFWNSIRATSGAAWREQVPRWQQQLGDEGIGRFPPPSVPASPRTRRWRETTAFVSYEVVLEVWPEVFAWGLLQVPRDLRPGERRPVVVCQHGLEGLPEDCLNQDPSSRAYRAYKGFAATLAERGFITFAPHNPYRGQDAFRVLQRKANPLGKSLFSIILGQHERILEWLGGLPFVDSRRIGFYGLSYGGKAAMRLPALLDGYCLSICSGDFNEWVRKNAATDYASSYLYAPEYEIFEWDLGHTFNYAEMAALIAPRPFMVERGHHDGVGTDEWVNYEYAKVRRFYAQLGLPDRTTIEHFPGPHTIHGQGTYEFLHRHLDWPGPGAAGGKGREGVR